MTLTRVVNAFSVDVEDYFMVSAAERMVPKSSWETYPSRVVPNTSHLLDLMSRRNVRGTFFVVGWVAERFPELVRRIAREGHEVGCHGYHHQLVYDLDPRTFRADLQRAKRAIEDALGRSISGYRAPSFSIVPSVSWALDILSEEGFEYDSSLLPAAHARGGWQENGNRRFPYRRGTITEFPISTARIMGRNFPFSGGGYLRLLPYWTIRTGIRRLNNQGRPAVVYLHPWELDPGQPRLPLSGMNRFRHYINLRRTEEKIGRIFEDFLWAPLHDVLLGLGHAPRKKVKIAS